MKNWPRSKKNQCHFYDKNRNTSIDTRLSYYTENIEKIKVKNYFKADNQKIDEIKKPKDLQNKNNSNTRIKLLCAWYATCVRNWPRKHSVDIEELATQVNNNDYCNSLTCDRDFQRHLHKHYRISSDRLTWYCKYPSWKC